MSIIIFSGVNCKWTIKVTTDWEVIQIRIIDSDIAASATCGDDYAQIQDGMKQGVTSGPPSWIGVRGGWLWMGVGECKSCLADSDIAASVTSRDYYTPRL